MIVLLQARFCVCVGGGGGGGHFISVDIFPFSVWYVTNKNDVP